jgi:hypothetical protein
MEKDNLYDILHTRRVRVAAIRRKKRHEAGYDDHLSHCARDGQTCWSAELGRGVPHWLRYCHGSHAIDHQAPLTVVRDTLGHSNIAVTNEYAKARPDQSPSGYLPLS